MDAEGQYKNCERCGIDLLLSRNVYAGFFVGGKQWRCLCQKCWTTLFEQEGEEATPCQSAEGA